jgi:hypothetical protein
MNIDVNTCKVQTSENFLKLHEERKYSPTLTRQNATVSHYRALLTLTHAVTVMTSGGGRFHRPSFQFIAFLSIEGTWSACSFSHIIQILTLGPSISVVLPIEEILFPECCWLADSRCPFMHGELWWKVNLPADTSQTIIQFGYVEFDCTSENKFTTIICRMLKNSITGDQPNTLVKRL